MWHVAFESVRISISVSLLVRAEGDPEEWPLWTRRTGVCQTYPLLTASVGRENSYFCRVLEFQAGSTPQRGQSDQRFFEVRWNLSGP